MQVGVVQSVYALVANLIDFGYITKFDHRLSSSAQPG